MEYAGPADSVTESRENMVEVSPASEQFLLNLFMSASHLDDASQYPKVVDASMPTSTPEDPLLVPSSQSTGSVFSSQAPPSTPPSVSPLSSQSRDIVPITEPELCKEQADLVDLICSGRNVFYTGSAGTGKSTVLKAAVKRLKELGKRVYTVAPTGRAALDINGMTTWSYAGWTPASHKKPLERLVREAHGRLVWSRFDRTDVLIIDEISMVENHHLERLNQIMKSARENSKAFGGVQIVTLGDFCQLPPVLPFEYCIKCGEKTTSEKRGTLYECAKCEVVYNDSDKWAFESQAWEEADFDHIKLTTIHRQSDTEFIDILDKFRLGKPLSSSDKHTLLNHDSMTDNAVKLYPRNKSVKSLNDKELAKLTDSPKIFESSDDYQPRGEQAKVKNKVEQREKALNKLDQHRFEPRIVLKRKMQVVLLVNLDIENGLVNGSQGEIVGFQPCDPTTMPRVATRGKYGDIQQVEIQKFIKKAEYKAWAVVQFYNGKRKAIYAQ